MKLSSLSRTLSLKMSCSVQHSYDLENKPDRVQDLIATFRDIFVGICVTKSRLEQHATYAELFRSRDQAVILCDNKDFLSSKADYLIHRDEVCDSSSHWPKVDLTSLLCSSLLLMTLSEHDQPMTTVKCMVSGCHSGRLRSRRPRMTIQRNKIHSR
jgi:hypothetical protein